METLEPILKEHPFLRDLKQLHFDIILGCASNVRFQEGEVIFREGEEANKFYLIRHGSVAVDIPTSSHSSLTIQTIHEGDIIGWSWLIPPYRARFLCRAMEDTRAIAFDGKCLREKCEQDHDLGYELLMRLTRVLTERLESTRMQLLDLYERTKE
jgi:CRP/FNR family transcriptional regulator, cyclic AMP receptor protein